MHPSNALRYGGSTNLFCSSRRRHTRCYRDWSSDVCSSDLNARLEGDEIVYLDRYDLGVAVQTDQRSEERRVGEEGRSRGAPYHLKKKKKKKVIPSREAGDLRTRRASCRQAARTCAVVWGSCDRGCRLYSVRCDVFFFFFQAEDGIRDATVTGVQTCALPIYRPAEGLDPQDEELSAEDG